MDANFGFPPLIDLHTRHGVNQLRDLSPCLAVTGMITDGCDGVVSWTIGDPPECRSDRCGSPGVAFKRVEDLEWWGTRECV